MSSGIPKFSEIQATAKDAIAAASLFKSKGIGVVADKGKSDKTVERHLRSKGFCIVIPPLIHWKLRDQSDAAWIFDVTVLVKIKLNPDRNSDDDGANIDIYEAVVEVTNALCRHTRQPGGERFEIAEDAGVLSQFDQGLWEYDLLFTKEVMV